MVDRWLRGQSDEGCDRKGFESDDLLSGARPRSKNRRGHLFGGQATQLGRENKKFFLISA
jgi:hypothetical protein